MTAPSVESLTHHPSMLAPAQLVERQQEMKFIWQQYEAAKAGSTRVVLMDGTIGIGKTRLLQAVAASARQDGATVLQGSASELAGMPPYLPFLEALGQHIRIAPQDQLHKQVAGIAPILVTVLPELETRLGELPAARTLPSDQVLLRLYEAIGTFLEAISHSNVLVLTFDDLHWADSASLELLCFLVRHHPSAKLLILGTYRQGSRAQNSPLERAINELIHQRMLTQITVGPLSAKEIETLAGSQLGGSLSSELNQLLYEQSEGNPFFAEELLLCWMERGLLAQHDNQWMAVAPLSHVLPASIVGVLRLRFAQLPTTIIDHLRVASIIGRTFDLALLARVEAQEMEVVEECLTEAEHAGLVRSERVGQFTFNHDMIRACLYSEVSSSRRRRLHQTIGTLLEERYNQANVKGATQLAELAYHFTQAGDQARSIRYSQQAAEQALYASAFKEAMTYDRIALTQLDSSDERRGTLLLHLGKAALKAEMVDEALEAYQEALEQFLRSNELDAALDAARGLGLAHWQAGNPAEAQSVFEQALKLAGSRQSAEVLQILIDLSTLLLTCTDQWAKGITYAQQTLELVDRLGEDQLKVSPLSANVANLHHLRGFLAYEREEYTTAEHEFLAATQTHQKGLAFPTGLLGLTQIALGKHQDALISLTHLENLLAEQSESSLSTAPLLTYLALMAIALNDQKRAQVVYSKLAAFRGQHHVFLVDRVLGELAMLCGDLKVATIHLAEAEAKAQDVELRPELARTLLAQAKLEVAHKGQSNATRERELLKRALELFEELQLPHAIAATRQLQEKLLSQQHHTMRRTFPLGLTGSEAKVLQFVVQGKSNRQIAQGLGISEKTVANHLSHIFYKTRSDNRAAAAAFAIHHGLE